MPETIQADGLAFSGAGRLIGNRPVRVPEVYAGGLFLLDIQRDGVADQRLRQVLFEILPAVGAGARIEISPWIAPARGQVLCIHRMSAYRVDQASLGVGTVFNTYLQADQKFEYRAAQRGPMADELLEGVAAPTVIGPNPGDGERSDVLAEIAAAAAGARLVYDGLPLYLVGDRPPTATTAGVTYHSGRVVPGGTQDVCYWSLTYSVAPIGVYPYR